MNENVIDFNAARLKLMEKRFDELTEEGVTEEDFIADFALTVTCDVMEAMAEFGFNPKDNPDCIKDVFAVIESLRGLLSRTKQTEHPFQQISDSMFDSMFEEEKDTTEIFTRFVEELEIELD